jgi:hypothetical protein
MANSHPLPNLAAFQPDVPRCILPMLDDLYKSMTHFDYRRRLVDFSRIRLRIQTCLLVLRNEKKYQRWRELKDRYRARRLEKLQRRADRTMLERDSGVIR